MREFVRIVERLGKIGAVTLVTMISAGDAVLAEKLCDHEVVLDDQGRLMPWTTYDNVLRWSMDFIKRCPSTRTRFGEDPWYLITSKLKPDGTFGRNQNNQGSNAYWAVETLAKYYAYSGDQEAISSVRLLLDRVLEFHTPADWAWGDVPRTQDDSPDGQYTDEWSGVDKICMAGVAYIKFYELTGEKRYLTRALDIAQTVAEHVKPGDATHSPLPFRVNLKSGEVLDPYTSNMIAAVMLFDELEKLGHSGQGAYKAKRDAIWQWILTYPVTNDNWSGYYEDVKPNPENMNQQVPLETARYILEHPEIDPEYKQHVPALISWVEERFGQTKRYGATSIREQDVCFVEMSSHTARYASVVAKWFGVTQDPRDREEARASFAVATYSAYSKYSKDGMGVNYVGIGYTDPWFSDSYFDYLAHILAGMAELPEMAPEGADHIIGSDSIVKRVIWAPKRIEYWTFEPNGTELLRLSFSPRVLVDGEPLSESRWSYGEYRGVPGVLHIRRVGATHVLIQED